ncbi:MAG TPA: hypothetical protein VLW85_23020, partial [Myxococcales bacterium]|nr:hypothetical protein [Myxococcales bacterium]
MRLERHIPDCRIRLEGQPLDLPVDAALVAAEVDLDDDLLGQCALLFIDRSLELTNGDRFQSGSKVKVEMGFGSALAELFDGEVTALEPQFRRDKPPALRVVCHEALHRLALSPMTRAFNDVDDRDIATAIAQEHGLSADAPQGTKTHVLQANVSDAQFLRRRARELGNRIR